jgi:glucose-1-phosphate cytidylyltransferase
VSVIACAGSVVKVVLFCGGLGTRLRDYSDQIPKPLVEVGSRPIMMHMMRYYAHYGHKEFILCLGHKGSTIKNYFRNYDECSFNDFVYEDGGKRVELLNRDTADWRITFVDTGQRSTIGERLRQVRKYLEPDEMFLANYSDALTDLDLGKYVADFRARGKVASFLSVRVPQTFHIVKADAEGYAQGLEHVGDSPIRINGGYFALRREIFDYMNPGEELVMEPFHRLIAKKQLLAVPYDGFWRSMDTFRDKTELDDVLAKGPAPWQPWLNAQSAV